MALLRQRCARHGLGAGGGYNIGRSAIDINNGNWVQAIITIDRNLGVSQNKVYINGVLSYTQDATYKADLSGNFVNNILFIGQRGGSSLGYTGSLMHLEILNYPITASEALADYNSFL